MCSNIPPTPGNHLPRWTLLSQAERNYFWNKVRETKGELGIEHAYYVDAENIKQRVVIDCKDEDLLARVADELVEIRENVGRLERCFKLPDAGKYGAKLHPDTWSHPDPEPDWIEFRAPASTDYKPNPEYL